MTSFDAVVWKIGESLALFVPYNSDIFVSSLLFKEGAGGFLSFERPVLDPFEQIREDSSEKKTKLHETGSSGDDFARGSHVRPAGYWNNTVELCNESIKIRLD